MLTAQPLDPSSASIEDDLAWVLYCNRRWINPIQASNSAVAMDDVPVDWGKKELVWTVTLHGKTEEHRGQDFKNHVTLERGVACTVHLSHSALAKQREDFVVTEFVADGKRHVLDSA
jgi:hypothetical protein